jgi:hypothetical protein
MAISLKLLLYLSLIKCKVAATQSEFKFDQGFSIVWPIIYTIIFLVCILSFIRLLLLIRFLQITYLLRNNIIDEFGDYIEDNISKKIRSKRFLETKNV